MHKNWYLLASIFVILAGLAWVIGNISANIIHLLPKAVELGPEIYYQVLVAGVLGSIALALAFFPAGIALLRLGKKKQTKLGNWSVILILVGIALILLLTIISLPSCLQHANQECLLSVFLFGVIPAGILYGVSLLLLIINWFTTRKH